jgi:hypothetical protein
MTLIPSDLAERARESLAAVIETGGQLAAKEPWRIARALGYSANWPIKDMTLFDVRAMIDRKIGEETRRKNHWTYSSSRLIALKQARRAMEIMGGEE